MSHTFQQFLEEANFGLTIEESLDTPVQVNYKPIKPIKNVEGHSFLIGSFFIGDKEFELVFETNNESIFKNVCINFAQLDGDRKLQTTNNLSKKEVLSVFSTVIKESIKFREYDAIFFEPNEEAKVSLYRSLAMKLKPSTHELQLMNGSYVMINKKFIDKEDTAEIKRINFKSKGKK